MERESKYISPVELFNRQIDERFNLWTSIIDDSKVKPETKNEIKKLLSYFKENACTKWDSLDGAVYGTISGILTITEKEKNNEEANALFENIHDDMWSFYKEIAF